VIFPAALGKGSTISVVAPSGPFDDELLRAGLARLSDFEVRIPTQLFGRRSGYFAGSDQERCAELQAALDEQDSDAILVARGGFGLSRLIAQLNFERFMRRPRWLIGFSDTTVLHVRLWQLGIASLHAPNGTTLARSSEQDLKALIQARTGNYTPQLAVRPRRPGRAQGQLVGGNLTVLVAEAAAGRLSIPDGAILVLEDVSETSYRVDRMLEALRAGGYFSRCSAVVFGEFADCSAGKFAVPVDEVIDAFAEQLTIPCASGLAVGHGVHNTPLILGAEVSLDLPDEIEGSLRFVAPKLA